MPPKDSDNLFNFILKHFQVFLQKISLSLHLFLRNELFNHAGAAAFFFILSIPPVCLLLLIAFAELISRKGPDRNCQFLPLDSKISIILFGCIGLFFGIEYFIPQFSESRGCARSAASRAKP